MTKTPLSTTVYADQMERWPQNGQHIMAQFDDETIIVYQAYCLSKATLL